MSNETITDLIAALRAAAQLDGPEFMTVPELAAWLRLDEKGVKNPERWIKDRLMPSHPERLPHCSFTRNNPVFSREHRAEIKARYSVNGASPDASAPAGEGAQVFEIDRKAIAAGARALGIAGTTA